MTATAAAANQAFTVAGLTVGSVTSVATARLLPDGSLERSSSLDVSGMSVAGVAVGFGPSGFTLAGTTTPFPNADALVGLLATQNTTLAYLQPVKTDHGVVAPALADHHGPARARPEPGDSDADPGPGAGVDRRRRRAERHRARCRRGRAPRPRCADRGGTPRSERPVRWQAVRARRCPSASTPLTPAGRQRSLEDLGGAIHLFGRRRRRAARPGVGASREPVRGEAAMEFLSWVRDQWDRVSAVVLVAVGALALLLGWLGISDALLPAEQLPYLLSGGLVGVFLLGLGATLWLSADLRDEWRKLDRLEEIVLGQAEADRGAAGGGGGDRRHPSMAVASAARRRRRSRPHDDTPAASRVRPVAARTPSPAS